MKTTKQILAENLAKLIASRNMTNNQVNTKAGFSSRAQVKRVLDAEFESTTESIDRIASVFGLASWQLIHPDLDAATPHGVVISKARHDFLLGLEAIFNRGKDQPTTYDTTPSKPRHLRVAEPDPPAYGATPNGHKHA